MKKKLHTIIIKTKSGKKEEYKCNDYFIILSDFKDASKKNKSIFKGIKMKTSSTSIPRCMGWIKWISNHLDKQQQDNYSKER